MIKINYTYVKSNMTEVIVPSNFEATTTPVYYTTIEVVKPAPKPISKKEELIESLDYLKNNHT
jgi:hypothetical protein